MLEYSQESQDRIAKLQELRNQGVNPYPERYNKQQTVAEALALGANEDELRSTDAVKADPTEQVQTAGRLVAFRDHGKLNFGQLQDHTGRMQICFMEDVIGSERVQFVHKYIDVADYIGVKGELFVTNHGELTLMVTEIELLSKAIRPLPEKWHGLKDTETKYRQRYLDLVSDRSTMDRFVLRAKFIQAMREFYDQHDFIELQTPCLVNKASGALAAPFTTHHNALDISVYLRIATETYLKQAVAGGFERVFEIGPDFRNEGTDPSHLQEFYMAEHYAAYRNFEDDMKFTEDMISYILNKLFGSLKVQIPDRDGELHEVDFTAPWPRATIQGLILKDSGIDIAEYKDADSLREVIEAKGIDLKDVPNYQELGYGNLVDSLYKKVSRPQLVEPTFLVSHPVELSPLARRNDEDSRITDRYQLVVSGWEIVNAYSELIDPVDQRQRLEEQAALKAGGDADAMMMDESFIKAMEHGMPPMAGWGMGIERFVALLTQQSNLRDVVLFPLLKPEDGGAPQADKPQKTTNPEKMKDIHETTTQGAGRMAHHKPNIEPEPVIDPGFTREQALELIDKYVDDNLKGHLHFVEAAMRGLAKHYGFADQADVWGLVGLLHDVDWSITQHEDDDKAHCGAKLDEILGEINASQEFIDAIRSHYWEHGVPVDTVLKKALFAVDELTGLIVAATLVRPSKKMGDVKVKSVKKKMKDKGFAAAVDRDLIKTCETALGTELPEFIELTLEAMKEIAPDWGM